MIQAQQPLQQFFDLDGSPLSNGSVYIGTENLNPETSPIVVYWDAAGTLPASQPLRTINGFVYRNGAPSQFFVNAQSYSMTVRDSRGSLVIYSPSISSIITNFFADLANTSDTSKGSALVGQSTQVVSSYATLRTIAPTTTRNIRIVSGSGGIDGDFYAVTGAVPGTYVDNGGTIIVPTGGDGGSCWMRVYSGAILPEWYGAALDGVTDDSSIFTAMKAVDDTFFIKSCFVAANITISSGEKWHFDNTTIIGSIDMTGAFNASVTGVLTILPPAGSTYGMKWRRTRYCNLGEIRIGDYSGVTITNCADNGAGLIRVTAAGHGLATGNYCKIIGVTGTTEAKGVWQVTVIDVNTFDLVSSTFVNAYVSGGEVSKAYEGKGLMIQGGPTAGTYYNSISKLVVRTMTDYGLDMSSDAGDSIFRIGTNTIKSAAVQYCANGVALVGASNNTFSDLSIEQCNGTVLKIRQVDANGLSNGNKFISLYTENPDKTTWIDTETTAVGTVVNLTNTADGTTAPANFSGAPGTVWASRDSFVVGTSGIDSYGNIEAWAASVNVYGATSDTNPRTQISGTLIYSGPGNAVADCVVGRQGVGLWGAGTATQLYSLGTYQYPFRLGSYRSWPDATGKLLLKSSAPASDTDGTSVGIGGTQSTVGAAGGASALPATPTGYAKVRIGGTEYVVPYYATS